MKERVQTLIKTNLSKRVPQISNKRKNNNATKNPQPSPKILIKWIQNHTYFGKLRPQFLDLILDVYFGIDIRAYFRHHFGPFLRPKPQQMRLPQQIRRRLIFGRPGMCSFGNLFGYFLGSIFGGVWVSWKL